MEKNEKTKKQKNRYQDYFQATQGANMYVSISQSVQNTNLDFLIPVLYYGSY